MNRGAQSEKTSASTDFDTNAPDRSPSSTADSSAPAGVPGSADTGRSDRPRRSGDRRGRFPGWLLLVLAAIAFWSIGQLPWIVTGMRLGISDAWPDVPPRGAPRVALPFNEYAFQPLLVGGVIGGAAAVTLSSWAAPSVRWRRTLAATAGLLALLIALGHTLQVVDGELGERREARLLVIALVGFALVSGVVGLLAGAVLARGRHGLAWPVAAALVAGLAGPWLNDLVHRSPALDGSWTDTIARWHPWVGGALLGICLGVWGARPAVRLIGTVAALAVLWVVPAALTALGYVTYYGTRTSPSRQTVSEVLDSGRDVFVEALKQTSAPVVGPLILALLLGLVGAVVTGSRSRPTPAVAPTA